MAVKAIPQPGDHCCASVEEIEMALARGMPASHHVAVVEQRAGMGSQGGPLQAVTTAALSLESPLTFLAAVMGLGPGVAVCMRVRRGGNRIR